MSAIFGIINKNGEPVEDEMIEKMQSSLLDRAVDGSGIVKAGNMMFGHHKLIVHRRQAQEKQPLQIDDLVITCDARIDNIEELFAELQLEKTTENFTDPFIILQAYKKWGDDCVNYLEGEFTLAIWNKGTKTFYGASDHIGFRTFYYYENKEIFSFASKIRTLEDIKTESLEINKKIFLDHYTNIHHPITYDKNIHVLQSAHFLLLPTNKRLKTKRYWLAKEVGKYKFKKADDWSDCVIRLVTKKIEYQIDSDYPIGILLSGGLDSSFITAIACKLLKEKNKKLYGFSSVLPEDYKGEDKDERFYIEKLKKTFDNLEVFYVTIPEDIGPYSNLDEVFIAVESPVNIFHYVDRALYEMARQQNVRTLLSGFGGDNTISNYGDVVIFQYLSQFKIARAYNLFIKGYKKSSYSLKHYFKREILSHFRLYKKLRSFFRKSDYYLYYPLQKNYLKKILKYENEQSWTYNKSFATSINNGEIGSDLLNIRKHSSSFKLEFLSPLLTKKICDLYLNIPGEELNGRSLIRRAMINLVPEEIHLRTDKFPFSPDHVKRFAMIEPECVDEFKTNIKPDLTRIDYNRLGILISNMNRDKLKTELNINKEIFYIPFTIISAEFFKWINHQK